MTNKNVFKSHDIRQNCHQTKLSPDKIFSRQNWHETKLVRDKIGTRQNWHETKLAQRQNCHNKKLLLQKIVATKYCRNSKLSHDCHITRQNCQFVNGQFLSQIKIGTGQNRRNSKLSQKLRNVVRGVSLNVWPELTTLLRSYTKQQAQ